MAIRQRYRIREHQGALRQSHEGEINGSAIRHTSNYAQMLLAFCQQ